VIFIQLARKFAGIFSSSAMLIVGSVALFNGMSFDFETVLNACKLSISAAAVAGLFGHYVGKTFEKSNMPKEKSVSSKKNSDLLIDDILDDNLDEINDETV